MFRRYSIVLVLILSINQVGVVCGQDSSIRIEKIIINYDSVLFDFNSDDYLKDLYQLNYKNNNLYFEVSCPDTLCMFTFYLEGHDEKWTSWSAHPVKEYTKLEPGKYSLLARTMTSGKISDVNTIINFSIKSPFYFSTLSILLYAVCFSLTVILLLKFLMSRQKMKQEHLESVIQERTEELMIEKEKTETLLANLLPKDTADEIMSKGKATKQKFNFVTVLFSDIQGFTRIAEEVNPEILIDELDNFFFHFDSVVEKHNIEKIKTIGDAYMCAGGIPHRNRTNPIEVVLAALEMQEYMNNLKKDQTRRGIKFWDIRIGIHTGIVIAGVVGQKKLSYDIWGDTVNTASRMESSGIPGKINISGITYEYIKDFFICEYRGRMPVKYKGDLDMYFVKGIRPELRSKGGSEPNNVFTNKLLAIRIQDLEDYYFEWYGENAPDDFVFHNLKFIKNICTQTELLARAELIDEEKILGLRLAALFVKSGMLTDYNDPVEYSVEKLKKIAPGYGFRDSFIEHGESIIRHLYSSETAEKEVRILLDAIDDYCGHVDYPEVIDLLYHEENSLVGFQDKKSWYTTELERIRNYEFLTDTARLLQSCKGEEQAEKLKKLFKHIK